MVTFDTPTMKNLINGLIEGQGWARQLDSFPVRIGLGPVISKIMRPD